MADTEKNNQNISNSENISHGMDLNTDVPESPRPLTPAFILTEDIGPVDGYQLGKKIGEIIGMNNIISVQETKSLWVLYIKSNESKVKLVSQGLSLDGLSVKVYGVNPFVLRTVLTTEMENSSMANAPIDNREWIRILIKDLRHSVSMHDVEHMLVNVYKIKITTEVKYARYRDENKKLTSLLNGDRFIWVHPDQLTHPLPRNAQCGIWKCRIFHRGQFPNSQNECFKCFGTDHRSQNCTNPPCCRICKEPGHNPGSPWCPHYTNEIDMRVIGGAQDPMSNHFEKTFPYMHVDGLTLENHWFNHKALKNGQEELAAMCLEAESGKEAKYLSHGINCTDDWDKGPMGYMLMKDMVREKLKHVKEARDDLFLCWYNNQIIVEGVHTFRDTYWGSGLNKEATRHTKPEYWPGNNKLGQIYMELADELFGANQWAEKTADNPYGKNVLAEPVPKSSPMPVPIVPSEVSTESNVPSEDTSVKSVDDLGLSESMDQSENTNVKPPNLPENMLSATQEQVNKTREQIGSLIAGIRSNTPTSSPQNSPRCSPRRTSKSPPPKRDVKQITIANKLRQIANAGGHLSRSTKKPAKMDLSPRSNSVKRSSSFPNENTCKQSKTHDSSPVKFENGMEKPS